MALALGRDNPVDATSTFAPTSTIALSPTTTTADALLNISLDNPSGSLGVSLLALTTPASAHVAKGPGYPGWSATTDPALGQVVGTLTTTVTLGLTNSPCAASTSVNWPLLNATVDITDVIQSVPQASTNTGDGGVRANQWTDDGASPNADAPWNDPGGWANTSATTEALTAAEQANGLPAQVDDYPSFLNTLFTKDGGTALQPLARYAGATNIAGTISTVNVVVFAPDALANHFSPPNPLSDFRDVGYVAVVVFNDPTSSGSAISVTDTCSPFSGSLILHAESKSNPCNNNTSSPCNTPAGINAPTPGLPTGKDRYRNPSVTGTHLWLSYYQSYRDKDGDGIENELDACASNSDNLDPRLFAGDVADDSDLDRIPNICDPNDADGKFDQDGDGWLNGQDNCPVNANATQAESETSQWYTVAAKRGGPRTDGIGNACDNQMTVADGNFYTTLTVQAICIGATDQDQDGWCSTGGNGLPADPDEGSGGKSKVPEAYDAVFPFPLVHAGSTAPLTRQPAQVCNDGIDNDGDGKIDLLDHGMSTNTAAQNATSCKPVNVQSAVSYPSCPTNGCPTDWDGDGYSNEQEVWAGTDPLGRCGVGTASPSEEWPADFVSGGTPSSTDRLTLGDILSFVAPAPKKLGANPGDAGPAPAAAYNRRWDIQAGPGPFSTHINISDLLSQISGASGLPPMFSGAKAFSGVVLTCSSHPVYGATP